jgi:nitroreductase
MEFWDLIRERRSIRKFGAGALPQGALEKILDAVRIAPTAGNLQAFRVSVVQDRALQEKLAAAAFGPDFLASAPAVLVFFAAPEDAGRDYGERGRTLYAMQDATIATLYAHLAASDLGLGSVWVGAFDTPTVARLLESPSRLVPVAMLPVGAPDETPPARPRKPLRDLLEGPAPGFIEGP